MKQHKAAAAKVVAGGHHWLADLLAWVCANCRSLTGPLLRHALQPCKDLLSLDIQHISLPAETVSQLEQELPLLKSVLRVQ